MPPRRSSRAASATREKPIEPLPIKRKRGQAVEPLPIKRKRGQAAEPVTIKQTTVIEHSDDDIEAPPSAQPRSQHNGAAQVVSNLTPEIEEEEKSLFGPPPMPEPSSLPHAIPEEPAGPKSRLVIHKMALINFKSYAGRQEIGPFHKVFNIRQTTV
jgi:structural maintenance of chromosome 4